MYYYEKNQNYKLPLTFKYIKSFKTYNGLIIEGKCKDFQKVGLQGYRGIDYYYLSHPMDTYQELYIKTIRKYHTSTTHLEGNPYQHPHFEELASNHTILGTVPNHHDGRDGTSTLVLISHLDPGTGIMTYVLCTIQIQTTEPADYSVRQPRLVTSTGDASKSSPEPVKINSRQTSLRVSYLDAPLSSSAGRSNRKFSSTPHSSVLKSTPLKFAWDRASDYFASPSPTSMLSSLTLGSTPYLKPLPPSKTSSLLCDNVKYKTGRSLPQNNHPSMGYSLLYKDAQKIMSPASTTLTPAEEDILRSMDCYTDPCPEQPDPRNLANRRSLTYLQPIWTKTMDKDNDSSPNCHSKSSKSDLGDDDSYTTVFATGKDFSGKSYLGFHLPTQQKLYLLDLGSLQYGEGEGRNERVDARSVDAACALPVEGTGLIAVIEPLSYDTIALYSGLLKVVNISLDIPELERLFPPFPNETPGRVNAPRPSPPPICQPQPAECERTKPGMESLLATSTVSLNSSNFLDFAAKNIRGLEASTPLGDFDSNRRALGRLKPEPGMIKMPLRLLFATKRHILYTVRGSSSDRTLIQAGTRIYHRDLPKLPCRTSMCSTLYKSIVKDISDGPCVASVNQFSVRWYSQKIKAESHVDDPEDNCAASYGLIPMNIL